MLDFIEFHMLPFWCKIFCSLWQPRNFETLGVSIAKSNTHDTEYQPKLVPPKYK